VDSEEYQRRFNLLVEEIAMIFEAEGLPRMTGRVLGYMMVCDPPHQSSSDLADGLNASRGAISTATRALVAAGFLQRRKVPGERSMYFELRPETIDRLFHGSIARIRVGRELTGRGLDLLAHGDTDSRRLEAFHELYTFMETEFPKLIARWDDKRREESS
jgi:hypothetical protein